MSERIAILDVGKTNTRLALLDVETGRELASARRANEQVTTARGRELDVAGIEQWLVRSLAGLPHKDTLTAIVPIAHGAAAVLLDAEYRVVAAPDYEDPRFEQVSTGYAQVRDGFDVTFSPALPLGLNLGRQWFYLEQCEPALFASVRHILTLPQYWAWRLCGVAASEVTSLGCHTDLWQPRALTYSPLVNARHWNRLLPPLTYAGDTLGTITSAVAQATGVNPACRVVCGIHDSNASWLQHRLSFPRGQPFAVLSSGTWTVLMASHVDLSRLDARRDMLANIDAFGQPVATARFMGGREYERIARTSVQPDSSSLTYIVDAQVLALPSFAAAGPFPNREGHIVRGEDLNDAHRASLATLYVALMSELALESLGVAGDVLIDGPLARNPLFASLLAALRPACRVSVGAQSELCARAACHLAGVGIADSPAPTQVQPLHFEGLAAYREAWRSAVAQE